MTKPNIGEGQKQAVRSSTIIEEDKLAEFEEFENNQLRNKKLNAINTAEYAELS